MFTSPKTKFSSMQLLLILLLLSLPLLLLRSSPSVSSSHCKFPAIFNLGDSNSDTGDHSAAFPPLKPPYGETFFGRPAGRLSDGRLIIDFIAESLGLPFLSAYLNSVGSNFSHGANFAASGAEILPPYTSGYSPFTLDVQLNQFLQFKSSSELVYKQVGILKDLVPKEEYFSQALYTFDIGQNDLTAKHSLNKSADEFIPDALKLFPKVIKSIYEKGGRYFWIHNTGPLGCLPYVLFEVESMDKDSVGCGIHYNELAQKFNTVLNETVVQLRRDLPLAAFTYVDVYSAKYLLISDPEKYGFELPFTTCCGYGGGDYNYDPSVNCGDTAEVNGTEVLIGTPCENPMKRIIWDGTHYTEAANKWVFDQIAGGKFSDPPNSLSMSCYKKA